MRENVEKNRSHFTTNSSGITLVALVVTIVVLLILAGITITLLFSNNGIIKQTQDAKEETRAGTVEDAKGLWQLDQKTAEYTSRTASESLNELLERLVREGSLTEEEKAEVEATGQVTIGSRTIVFGSTAKTLVEAFNDGEIKVGDYINYIPTTGTISFEQAKTGVEATQTYSVDTNTTWRVLGLNEAGTQLLITSGSPIKRNGDDPYLHLASGEGYTYCEEVLDGICGIYKNSKYASEARSMRMEDITNALEITIDKVNNKAYKTGDETQTELPYEGFFGQSYTYKSGDYAPENYMGTGTKRVGDTVEGSAYGIPYTESSIVDPTSAIYDVLFAGTTEADNYAKAYWLASPGVCINSDYANFGPGVVYYGFAGAGFDVFGSDGGFGEGWMAVRPVVSLKSDVSVEDLKIISGSEESWTTSVPSSWSGQSLTKGQVLESEYVEE